MPDPVVNATAPAAAPTPATPSVVPPVEGAKPPMDAKAPPPAASAKAEAPKPTAAEIRKLKVKLDGADIDMSEEDVIKLAQKGGSAEKRFLEAANLKKQVEQVLDLLKTNPAEAMKRLGQDPRKFSEEFLVEALKREAESPEQKRIRETEEKLKNYEKQETVREATAKKQAEEAAASAKQKANAEKEAQIIAKFDSIFTEALSKSGLPKNARTVARMAELQRVNLRSKGGYTAEQLAEVVRQDYDSEFKTRTDDLNGDQIIELLSRVNPDLLKKITKAQIAKLKGAPQKFSQNTAQVPVTQDEGTGMHKNWRELQKARRRFQ